MRVGLDWITHLLYVMDIAGRCWIRKYIQSDVRSPPKYPQVPVQRPSDLVRLRTPETEGETFNRPFVRDYDRLGKTQRIFSTFASIFQSIFKY